METDTTRLVVIGAGVMGRGIALTALRAGLEVFLVDPNQSMGSLLEKEAHNFVAHEAKKGRISPEEAHTALSRLHFLPQWRALPVQYCIEAVVERLAVKQEVFALAEKYLPPDTLFATNTSTLPVARIARSLARPGRLVGMHFFNPATVMPLIEVVAPASADAGAVSAIEALAEALGKTPVRVKDSPGFVVNRAARFFYLESLRLLEEGGIEPEAVDQLMRDTGFKMGPFELMDLIGVDTNHAVSQSLYESFFYDPRYRPSWLQQAMVDDGRIGRKSGRGFFRYPSSP